MQKRNEPRQAIRYVSQAEIAVIDGFALMLTDGHTDGHTDRPSCRDARTHLKSIFYITILVNLTDTIETDPDPVFYSIYHRERSQLEVYKAFFLFAR